jgi:hypothetical protein
MAISVGMQNPDTGEIKLVKVGWSWVLFFFSGFFGVPLFLRKLTTWGFVFLANSTFSFICLLVGSPTAQAWQILVQLVATVLAIFMGVKGNEITAKNYLALGWKFTDQTSEMTKYAKMHWHIFDQPDFPQTPAPREVRW